MSTVFDRTEREVDPSPGYSDGSSTSMMAQKRFLEELLQDPSRIEAFSRDPETYARERGVELDPDVIRRLADEALVAMNVPEDLRDIVRDACPDGIPAASPTQLDPQGASPLAAIVVGVGMGVVAYGYVTYSASSHIELPDETFDPAPWYPGEYDLDYSDSDIQGERGTMESTGPSA